MPMYRIIVVLLDDLSSHTVGYVDEISQVYQPILVGSEVFVFC
jgi:hypothetical protein